jgi:two-component system, OmpR family, response regulator ChvI
MGISTGSNSSNSSTSTSNTTSATIKKDPSSFTILIVDDEPDVTFVYKQVLEDVGFKVNIFNDPLAALSKLKEIYSHFPNVQQKTTTTATRTTTTKPYDLLLLDVRMPKMNGFELYREAKKIIKKGHEDREGDIKTCFITAHEVYYEQLKEEFPKIDVGCFIKKPIPAEDLVKRIKEELVLE